MRSRSSRLFVVLLHLVGVSTKFPRNPFLAALHPDNLRSGVGIVGVHPLSILLEPLELQAAGGLGELLSLLEGAGYDVEKTVLGEPYWLQDDTDGRCLGPDGFSECGDATLWKIRRRPVNASLIDSMHRRDKRGKVSVRNSGDQSPVGWIFSTFFGRDDSNQDEVDSEDSRSTTSNDASSATTWEYSLELVDVNSLPPFGIGNENEHGSPGECVISFLADGGSQSGSLEMGSCSSNEAWSWSINEGGVLKWDEKIRAQHESNNQNDEMGKTLLGGPIGRFMQMSTDHHSDLSQIEQLEQGESTRCLWRFNETSARTEPCDASTTDTQETTKRRLVGLSVIQYQNSAAVSPKLPRFSDGVEQKAGTNLREKVTSTFSSLSKQSTTNTESHLPHTKSQSTSRSTSDTHHHVNVPLGVGGYSERPKLVHSSTHSGKETKRLSPMGVGGYFEKSEGKKVGESKTKLLHRPPSASSTLPPHMHQEAPLKPRKIPIHPYIAASKDGIYEDPSTGLQFPTDLHSYLGHERKVSGRHTLMGVGLFTKTMLKIKIYAVGLYVPKRDVLADSNFAPFAGMDVTELRKNDAFYHHLTDEGFVDRTLFIKLNMQLSTETVRQSLSAEWQLLSDERKNLLAQSSATPREAEAAMLEKIKSEENTSNCSCGQTAPPEYEADESCCARGTEMVFTWRKNGNLELRIDGRVMDVFEDPVMGKGIFHEYLRGDDPMSMDARDHFADGFPFLLAPLAQVKGVSSSMPNPQDSAAEGRNTPERKPFTKTKKLAEDLINNISSRTSDASSWVQGNINGGVTNIGNAISTLSKNTQNMGSELTRRREQLMSHFSPEQVMNQLSPEQIMSNISSMQEQSTRFFTSRAPFTKKRPDLKDELETKKPYETRSKSSKRRRDVFRHHLAKLLDESPTKRPLSDEIGVIIEPVMSSTHMLFLYMVHFYLVLLLIVSVPDLNTNRLVVRRSSVSTMDSESDHEERLTELEGCDICCWEQIPLNDTRNGSVPHYVVEHDQYKTSNLKKSLSYYL